MSAADERARYIDGLRVLAAALENHPEVPLPYDGTSSPLSIFFLTSDDPRAEMAAAARALPCAWTKTFRDEQDVNGRMSPAVLHLDGSIAGLAVKLTAYRDAVCKRVVTGTEEREVEEVVTPAVTRTVTREVEKVDWVCGPVLGAVAGHAAPALEGAA